MRGILKTCSKCLDYLDLSNVVRNTNKKNMIHVFLVWLNTHMCNLETCLLAQSTYFDTLCYSRDLVKVPKKCTHSALSVRVKIDQCSMCFQIQPESWSNAGFDEIYFSKEKLDLHSTLTALVGKYICCSAALSTIRFNSLFGPTEI